MRVLLVWLVFGTALPAHAWVAATVGTGCMDRWYTPSVDAAQVTMMTDSAGISGIAANDVHAALQSALKTWNNVQCDLCANPGGAGCVPESCASHSLGVTLLDGGIGAHTPWGLPCGATNPDGSCKSVQPNGNYVVAVSKKSDWLWSQFAAAQTVVTANQATGEIIDADILFNLAPRADGSTFQFCEGDCAAKLSAYPLCIPLTHELGHVLGLNHSADVKATMAASAVPSDVYKCALSDDDTLGVCTEYRSTCSGATTKPWLPEATCAANAKLNAADATGDATTDTGSTTPASSCQASPRANSPWMLLFLGVAATAIRLGSGRSRARRT